MISVDIADQLRSNYNVGHGLMQRKWWWSIFFWGIDVTIVNSYLIFKSRYEMHDLKPITHYHFREKIALEWLDEYQFWSTRRYSRRPRSTPEIRKNTSSTKSLKLSSFSSAQETRSVATSSTISTSSARKSCKTPNQTALSKYLLIKDLSSLMSTHICQHQQHPSIQNVNCINGQRNRFHIVQIVMYAFASNATRHSILNWTCNV